MRGLKNRIEKLEEEAAPQEFKEIRLLNPSLCPGALWGYGKEIKKEIIMRVPVKKRRKR